MAVFPEWYPATTGGTQSLSHAPVGYNPPAVLQPQGNYDAWDVVYDAPADPFWDRPQPTSYPVRPPDCVAPRPADAQLPDGTRVWEKSLPGAPILTGPGGSMIAPSPIMPSSERGTMYLAAETLGNGNGQVLEAEMSAGEAGNELLRGGLGALGAVIALGVVAWLGFKARG
jgi:hypothetical protein